MNDGDDDEKTLKTLVGISSRRPRSKPLCCSGADCRGAVELRAEKYVCVDCGKEHEKLAELALKS